MPRRARSPSSSMMPSSPPGGKAGSRAGTNTSRARSGSTRKPWATPKKAPSLIPAPRWRRMSSRICDEPRSPRESSSPASGIRPSPLRGEGCEIGDDGEGKSRQGRGRKVTLRRPEDLVAAGLVPPERLPEIAAVAREFAISVTPAMAELVDPADPADPIAAQFVPSAAELTTAPEERADPIGDERWSPVPGIVHRHADRVLLKPTLLCPVYCRFCFRREVVGKKAAMLAPAALERAFDYIRGHPEIWEVIVTGGDPLLLSARRVGGIVRVLEGIEHVAVIRFHTRVPVVDPDRMRPALVRALDAGK